jgi:hypothetical protein
MVGTGRSLLPPADGLPAAPSLHGAKATGEEDQATG